MGLYGNITNLKDIHFQFDKQFSNRLEMENSVKKGEDNVFIGRFVLVSYDTQTRQNIKIAYSPSDLEGTNVVLYADKNFNNPIYYTTFQQVEANQLNSADWNKYYYKEDNQYYKLSSQNLYSSSSIYYTATDIEHENIAYDGAIFQIRTVEGNLLNYFFRCNNIAEVGEIAKWDLIIAGDSSFSQYLINFNIDQTYYQGDFDYRGYDGTIWQKVYDGKNGKYNLIARLNGGLPPTLELCEHAPSLDPFSPYIDSKSANDYYRIHIPTQWGLQVKQAQDTNLSDATVVRERTEIIDDTPSIVTEEIPADIYFNLQGANKYYKHRDDYTLNKLILTPTGESGKVYEGNETIDKLEWGLHFPAIGNMISDGYDLIYGTTDNQTANGDYVRPTDVNFYPGDSSNDLKQNGNSLLGGKSKNLSTIAGTLNDIHNKLGQIIISLNGNYNVQDLSEDYIYQMNNKYYRKGIVYNEQEVTDMFRYDKVPNLAEEDFSLNKYYEGKGNNVYEPAESYSSTVANSSQDDKGYFLKQINSIRYTPIALEQFISGIYYLKNGDNYICDNSENLPLSDTRNYYTIQRDQTFSFDSAYQTDGSFYIIDNEGNYISYTESNPDRNLTYYNLQEIRERQEKRFYYPNIYFTYTEEDGYQLATKSIAEFNEYSPNTVFYIIQHDMEHPQYGMTPDGKSILVYPQIGEPILVGTLTVPGNYYFKQGSNYLKYNQLDNFDFINGIDPHAVERTYYEVTLSNPYSAQSLFLPNVYYIYNSISHDYTKAFNWERGENYYLISASLVNNKFYFPGKYYYQESQNIYVLDEGLTKRNTQYYIKTRLYVLNDEYDNCPYGYEWSDYAAYIPPSISLCTREEAYGLIEMNDAVSGEMSINSILLKLNKICDINDETTRNKNTLNGILNMLKDILYQIKVLIPGRILNVNDFGQITSSNIEYNDLKKLIAKAKNENWI